MIKLFEDFNEIHKICKDYDITNYTITPSGAIDCNDHVNLAGYALTEIPLKFGIAYKGFIISDNKLTSLINSPTMVYGDFLCRSNKLTSLEHSPLEVTGGFDCSNNDLTSLINCPRKIGSHFYFETNDVVDFKNVKCEIGGILNGYNNQLITLDNIPNANAYELIDPEFEVDNDFPKEIKDNYRYLYAIIKFQEEYGIWRNDGTLNMPRFKKLLNYIENKDTKCPNCMNKGVIICDYCEGYGTVPCVECEGDGCEDCDYETIRQCPECNGEPIEKCNKC